MKEVIPLTVFFSMKLDVSMRGCAHPTPAVPNKGPSCIQTKSRCHCVVTATS